MNYQKLTLSMLCAIVLSTGAAFAAEDTAGGIDTNSYLNDPGVYSSTENPPVEVVTPEVTTPPADLIPEPTPPPTPPPAPVSNTKSKSTTVPAAKTTSKAGSVINSHSLDEIIYKVSRAINNLQNYGSDLNGHAPKAIGYLEQALKELQEARQ